MFQRVTNAKVQAGRLNTKIHHTHSQSPSRRVTIKEAHFDERNLDVTKPKKKDYGLLVVTESKTPYPRKENPVDATILRDRLIEQLTKRSPSLNSIDIELDMGLLSGSPSPVSTSSSRKSVEVIPFAELRKRFYHGEFTLTRQRDMRDVIHPHGELISNDLTRASIFQT